VQQRPFVRTLALVVLAAIASSLGPRAAGAQSSLPEVTYGIVGAPGAAGWPILLAQTQGFFKDEGIALTTIQGASPPNVISQVATGAINMAGNGCDSEIAAIAHGLPIKIVAPMFTVNPYSLVVVPGVKTWADLKGKSVMLATKQDVTAIAFSEMAAAQHLTLDDFSILLGGSSDQRFAGLASGNVQGVMLTQPYDFVAESKGNRILGSAVDTTKNWVFNCIFANNAWAAKNRPLVVKFLRALRRGMQYGYTHKAVAVAALVAQAHIDPPIAAHAWDVDFGKWKAYDPDLKLSTAALQNIGKYQIGFGVIAALPPIADLYDPSYTAEALR
jgi:ABC-type nitrate/sulfonate/bicarbonate transport system substrate-binding protein